MNLLVIGSGAREHAIAWKLSQSTRVGRLFVAPGNAGTAHLATNLPIPATDQEALALAAKQHSIDITVVGPEAPLAEGIVDYFQRQGLRIFGPSRAAARIEASKVFARQLVDKYGIPQPRWQAFDDYHAARRYVESLEPPMVIKADGLAAGKGVTVARTRDEALQALHSAMVSRAFGAAGEHVLVEECLVGRELSVFAFTDGSYVSPVVGACDYKRLLDGDQGPNTGGMGSYSPPEFLDRSLAQRVHKEIMEPTVHAMAREGSPYQGVLYGGLMLTSQGPKVLEFNCRLGDPETQVILPLLKTDLVDIIEATLTGTLPRAAIQWSAGACVGVVVASGGYPGAYKSGFPIGGLDSLAQDAMAFHAGTRQVGEVVVTDGGRVLTVAAVGDSLSEARERTYRCLEGVSFQGCHYRRDIAALAQTAQHRKVP